MSKDKQDKKKLTKEQIRKFREFKRLNLDSKELKSKKR